VIVWREKIRAFLLHFTVTLAMAVAAAVMIFGVWFPPPFQTMLGGTKLFVLISSCDLVLGPLTSLIIYNSKKTRLALTFDYTVIGILQLTAFIFGIYSMAHARPIYVAYVDDHYEIVISDDIADKDLQAAQDPYRSRPKFGPRMVGTERPVAQADRNMLILASTDGKDRQHFPKFYVPYEKNLPAVQKHAKPLEELEKLRPQATQMIEEARLDLPRERVRWLSVRLPNGSFWTTLLDERTGRILEYLPVDSGV